MILKNNQPAPDFETRDVWGNLIHLNALKGKKVLLTFYRHIGCPVHHLRFLELSKYDKQFRDKQLVVLAVFESCPENLRKYSETEDHYATLIADRDFELYKLYDIEVSNLKLLFSMYRGVFAKQMEGKKQTKHQFEPEGHRDLMGGEFLIDEQGKLKRVYYNQYLGDHLPIDEIISFVNNPLYQPAPEPSSYCGSQNEV